MPSLKQKVAEKKAQESALRRTPEIDAKLDAFIQENPKLMEYYEQFTKEELIRKLVLPKMRRSEFVEGQSATLKEWAEANPDVKAKIEDRIRNVPEQYRERAFLKAASAEAANHTVKASRSVSV